MTRKRYIQDPTTNELIEITDSHSPGMRPDSGALWGDRSYDGMRASDGTNISTRTKQREYMKTNNLTTVDDFKETWAKAKESRESYVQRGGSFTKSDIERAIHQTQNKR